MKEIPGRIMLSEKTFVTVSSKILFYMIKRNKYLNCISQLKNPKDLRKLMMKAINEGLEGLVLKDAKVNKISSKSQLTFLLVIHLIFACRVFMSQECVIGSR